MTVTLSSMQNQIIKDIRALYTKKGRREAGLTVVEGVHPLEEAVRAGWPVATVLYTERFAEGAEGGPLLDKLSAAGARLVAVTDDVLERTAETETPQGVLGTLAPRLHPVADLVRQRAGGKPPLLLVCDGLQDPGNLGTLWRAAHAFGARGVVLTSNTAEPFSPKVIRAATGSVFHLPVAVEPDAAAALATLRQAGLKVAVADSGRGEEPERLRLGGAVALVVGNEGSGPADVWLEDADLHLRIPMPGGTESLNAGVAGSILLYEASRQRLAERR